MAFDTRLIPAETYEAVTPSDVTNFAKPTKGIYIGGAGDVAAVGLDGVAVTFTALAVGVIHRISCIRVNSTNTSATSIVALF